MAETLKSRWSWYDWLLLIGFIMLGICVFTNLIFLIEAGVINAEVGKKFTNKTLRIPVAIFFGLIAVFYYFRPRIFLSLRFVTAFKEGILKYTWPLIFFSAVSYFVILSGVNVARHLALETRAFDLGIFAQALWNSLQGDWLLSSIKGNISYLGDHASPILFLLVPLYGVWTDPMCLLILQVFMSALCVLPLTMIVWQKTNSRGLCFIFALLYLIYAPTRSALHEDFHPEVLVEPFMFFAFYFLEKKRLGLFLFNLLIVALAKENMLGICFAFGLYTVLFKTFKKTGVGIMLASIAIFILEIKWLIPTMGDGTYLYGASYDFAGLSIFKALGLVLGDGDRWEYVLKVFLPFSFLPVFHLPTLLLAFPVMAQNFLSENETMRSFSYHYTAGMTPFMFISAIYGFEFVTSRILKTERWRTLLLVLIIAIALMRSGPSEYYYYYHSNSHRSEHTDLIRKKLSEIPQDAILLTHNNFIPQAVNRRHIYQFDYTAHLSKTDQAQQVNADYVVMDKRFWEEASGELESNLKQLSESGYQTEFEKDGFYILKKSHA